MLVAIILVWLTVLIMSTLNVEDNMFIVFVILSSVIGCVSGMFLSNWVYERIQMRRRKKKDKRTHLSLIVFFVVLGVLSSCESRKPHTETILQPETIDSIFVVNVVYNKYADFYSPLVFEVYITANDKYDADRIFNGLGFDMITIDSYTIRPEKLWR